MSYVKHIGSCSDSTTQLHLYTEIQSVVSKQLPWLTPHPKVNSGVDNYQYRTRLSGMGLSIDHKCFHRQSFPHAFIVCATLSPKDCVIYCDQLT